MGTWDAGPFDNDAAADFCGDLDEAAPGDREGLVRSTLTHVVETAGYLDAHDADEAVAAAALVAAQCTGGDPADPVYGPDEPLPDLTGLRELAFDALARVTTEPSELMELWADSDGATWRANVQSLQTVLRPRPPGAV
ncbi:DUF4259 domain-containing protein [Streptomyces sp. NPDC091268]|uniref:DUF4259 domain-containing protein n=1 Tax=Streptomyces sp. NPDC091268 TaxID=3365979 RepID=UPI0038273608